MVGSGIIFNEDLDKLNQEIFNKFKDSLNNLFSNESIIIGLSGGRSYLGFYNLLKEKSSEIEPRIWSKIMFCFVDERIVELSSNDSNFKLVNELLFKDLIQSNLISEDQIIKINLNSENIEKDYSSRVSRIDIGFFGAGEDGHIASLFSDSIFLNYIENNFFRIDNSPKLPSSRISLSRKMIEHITYSFLVFIGESKLNAFKNFKNNELSFNKCPAKFVKKSKNYFIFTNLK